MLIMNDAMGCEWVARDAMAGHWMRGKGCADWVLSNSALGREGVVGRDGKGCRLAVWRVVPHREAEQWSGDCDMKSSLVCNSVGVD
jgi:hypothetical protein